MINIRYHIVSITAIFLALGIGVALGSTFLERATVERIDDNVRDAEDEIRETRAENGRLTDARDDAQERDEALIEAADMLFDDLLVDQTVLMVVAPGVDQATVDGLREVLVRADADVRGVLALGDGLTEAEDPLDESVLDALEVDETDPTEARTAVLQQLVDVLVAAGASDPSDLEEPPDGTQPTVVTELVEADLVQVDAGPGREADAPILEETGYHYLYLTQPDLEPTADPLLLDLLPPTQTSPPLPATVVSVTSVDPTDGDEEPPVTAVDLVRDDDERSALYSTVDDVDTFLGMLSTVMVLAADEGTVAGHYGQGEGATALTPAVP